MSITTSLKFAPKGPINNIPALVQVMAFRRSGDKPVSESIMFRLLTRICVIQRRRLKLSIGEYIIPIFSLVKRIRKHKTTTTFEIVCSRVSIHFLNETAHHSMERELKFLYACNASLCILTLCAVDWQSQSIVVTGQWHIDNWTFFGLLQQCVFISNQRGRN